MRGGGAAADACSVAVAGVGLFMWSDQGSNPTSDVKQLTFSGRLLSKHYLTLTRIKSNPNTNPKPNSKTIKTLLLPTRTLAHGMRAPRRAHLNISAYPYLYL